MMLLAESFARILDVCGNGKLKGLAEGLLSDQIPCVLIQILRLTLQEQAENGSWGNGSCEVTAYAVLTLSALVSAQATSPLHNTLRSALRTGCSYLTNHADQWKKPHRLWIEKVSYSSPVLSEAYCLAAVSAALYGLKTTEITDEVDCDKQITSMSDFFSRLPIFASCPLWQLKTSLLESNIYRRRLEACRLDIFPRKDMAEDKYLKYIPFTWLGCYRLVATDVPSATLWDMIYVSMLNYQVDEYMEAVVSGICSHSPDLVRSCIRRICGASEGTKDMSAGESYQFTHADSCEKMVGTSHSHGLTTPEESESELSITLSEIEETLSKYVMHFLKHPAVLRTPGAVQHRLRVAIETFLLAHVEQIVDSGQFSKQESNVIFFTQKAYYDWVHTNSAIHTSCPFSFMFYCCLVSESGMELFRSVKSKYLAQAAIGHLATLCRQYNDYGSAIRDSIEGNLNSLNFPEFFEDTGRHQASTREDSEGAFGKQKADLYWLAEYERESLKGALHKLAQEVDEDTMGKVILFVNVTDLYGQIYVAKDIGSRMK